MGTPTLKNSDKTSPKASAYRNTACLTLEYQLEELPCSQYRAGLAALILLTRWMAEKGLSKGQCYFRTVTSTQAILQLDREGLVALFDIAFAATLQPQEERDFALLRPSGAFLADYDPCQKEQRWLSLWQHVMIRVIRKKPSSRLPFLRRAKGKPTKDADDCWKKLNANKTEQLSGTYLLGARAQNSEKKSFITTSQWKFLLYFWPFLMWTYRLAETNRDNQLSQTDYLIGIPDIADLQLFCQRFAAIFKQRDVTIISQYMLRESLVASTVEAGIHALSTFYQGGSLHEGAKTLQCAVSGFDVFRVAEGKHDIHIKEIARQANDEPSLLEAYKTLKRQYSSYIFQREQLNNLINDQPFWSGVTQLLQRAPKATTFGSYSFCKDSQTLFTQFTEGDNNMKAKKKSGHAEVTAAKENTGNNTLTTEIDDSAAKKKFERIPSDTIEAAIYNLVKTYLAKRLATQYKFNWEVMKDSPELVKKYRNKRQSIACRLFYDLQRRRNNQEFISFFASKLCSVSQQINEREFMLIAHCLFNDTEKVRALTQMALSAR